jgi:hypothetical protein
VTPAWLITGVITEIGVAEHLDGCSFIDIPSFLKKCGIAAEKCHNAAQPSEWLAKRPEQSAAAAAAAP